MDALLFLLIVVVGGVLLQIVLSKREAKWPGPPLLTSLYALVLGAAAYDGQFPRGPIPACLAAENIPTVIRPSTSPAGRS